MFSMKRYVCLLVIAVFALTGVAYAQETGIPDFGFDLGIGVESFDEIDEITGEIGPVAYQTLSLNPDFEIGKFGIGLAITIHYTFTGGPENDEFAIREEDWVPDENNSFLDLYLPLFRYVRWGFRGEPLYIKLGSIDDATLGNGFIMGNYDNTLFLPDVRIFGLNFDLDGNLFKFPYVGMQSFVGNLANFDVVGGRIFARPLAWLSIPILQHLVIGYTVAGDTDPFYYARDAEPDNAEDILIHGADFMLPILSNKIFSLALFGDLVFQRANTGGMVGFGGRLFNFLPYGFQARFLGPNFIPGYFGATYDVYRPMYYDIITSTEELFPAYSGWFGSTGLSFFDMIAVNSAPPSALRWR